MSTDEECLALSPQFVCIQSVLEKRKLISFLFEIKVTQLCMCVKICYCCARVGARVGKLQHL